MEHARPQMLTVQQAAKRLALSPATIRSWVWHRRIEHTRLGRAIRISETVCDELIKRGTVPVAGPEAA